MICPKCGAKTRVVDNSRNCIQLETYRKRVCNECGHIFFTAEIEVENTREFREEYAKGHRLIKRYKKWAIENFYDQTPSKFAEVVERLAQFEAIGMEPGKLKKAAELYTKAKELL
jgi:hypothetical protein